MKRTVIKIDENLCNGCGSCVGGCHEGALRIVNGKAVMISDLYCDGLGACIGECPLGAITLEERETQPYDEVAVMERLVPKGDAVILAHLKHLKDHNEYGWVREGIGYLRDHNVEIDLSEIGLSAEDKPGAAAEAEGDAEVPREPSTPAVKPLACGCPGSMAREIKRPQGRFPMAGTGLRIDMYRQSELRQFPVQLHLLNPQAGFLRDADLLLAADCTAFANGEFHSRFLRGKSLAIACPKLDSNIPSYIAKLADMIDVAGINTLTVLVMEVPCCQGLVGIARAARGKADRNVPLKVITLSVSGDLIEDKWL